MAGEVLQDGSGDGQEWPSLSETFVTLGDCNAYFPEDHTFEKVEGALGVVDASGNLVALVNDASWQIAWRKGTKTLLLPHDENGEAQVPPSMRGTA